MLLDRATTGVHHLNGFFSSSHFVSIDSIGLWIGMREALRKVRSPPILLRSYLWSTAQRRASANGGDALDVRGSVLRVAVKVWAAMLDNSTVGKRPEISPCRRELIPPDTQYVAPQWKIRKVIQFTRRSAVHRSLVVHHSGTL